MKYPTPRTPPSRRHRSNPAHIDLLPGGLADEYRPRDFNRQQLHSGSRVEREHTRDRTLAQEIAMDHLVEDPAYYHRLAKFERRNPTALLARQPPRTNADTPWTLCELPEFHVTLYEWHTPDLGQARFAVGQGAALADLLSATPAYRKHVGAQAWLRQLQGVVAHLDHIQVHGEPGQGTGSRLLDEVLHHMGSLGVQTVLVHVKRVDDYADDRLRFFHTHGFMDVSVDKGLSTMQFMALTELRGSLTDAVPATRPRRKNTGGLTDPAHYRRNPVFGPPQPVLPGLPEVWGTEDMALPQRWQDSTPMDLLHAVKQRLVFEDEFAEMEALVEDVGYRGVHEAAERHGTSVKMAADLAGGLYDTLVTVAEEKSEALVEAFVAFFRAMARAEGDYRKEQSHEHYIDYFLSDTGRQQSRQYANEVLDQVQDAFREQHPDAPELTLDVLADVLFDPDMYDIEAKDQGLSAPDLAVDSFNEEQVETQVGWRWSGGGSADFQQVLESMTDPEVATAIEKLANDDPYFHFKPWPRTDVDKAFFLNSESSEVSFTVDLTIYWVVNLPKVLQALADREPEEDATPAPPSLDNIVYRYSGTHDTVAGASARGMYVALLRPDQLRQEGADLGICVGRQDMGYRDQVIDGTLNIYSIRTESGRPKFTISVYRRPLQVSQVKGKANRLPGFTAGGAVFSKEDEVRLVIEFLMSLGIQPADIAAVFDLKAGIAGLRALGQDPFTPKPVRALPRGNGTSREVAYWAKKAYSIPMGGKWGV